MPAGPPYGNRNAEKWKFKKAVKLFKDAIYQSNLSRELINKEGIKVIAYKYDFIGEIARELGTFHEIFEHLVKRFSSLQRLKNELYTNIQTNCYSNTKNGVIREATGIVNLKSNWKWKDRQDLTTDDQEIKGTTIIVQDQQTVKEIKKLDEND